MTKTVERYFDPDEDEVVFAHILHNYKSEMASMGVDARIEIVSFPPIVEKRVFASDIALIFKYTDKIGRARKRINPLQAKKFYLPSGNPRYSIGDTYNLTAKFGGFNSSQNKILRIIDQI